MSRVRRIRFTIRILLLATSLVAIAVGVVTNQLRGSACAIRSVRALGGSIVYASHVSEDNDNPIVISSSARTKPWLSTWFGEEFGEVPAIVYFDGSHPLHDCDLAFLKKMPDLRSLDFNASNITDLGARHLAGMRYLQILSLENSRITDEGLKHLASVDALVELRLRDAPITSAGLRNLRLRAKKNLRIIDLAGTHVGDDELEGLMGLPRLYLVDLTSSKITDLAIPTLARLPNGACVFVTDTNVTEHGYAELVRLNPSLNVN